jgi:TolB-like protein
MLSGRRAFVGDTPADTISAILTGEPPPLAASGSNAPPALQGIVDRCLEKSPELRFSSAHDLALALGTVSLTGPTAPTAPMPRAGQWLRRPWLIGTAGVGLLAVAAGLLVWAPWRRTAPAASLDPKRIVVAIFENRTGDASLDPLGRQAAESIIGELSKVTTVNVSPSSTILPALAGGTDTASKGDPVHALAESAGAGVVVSGAYYLEGPTLQIQAKVTDVAAGKLLWPIDPASAPREKPGEAVETIRQRLFDVVAARYLTEGRDMLVWEGRPPRYEALVECVKGDNLRGSDVPAALAQYRRALDLDPGFLSARGGVAAALFYMGRFADADAEWNRLEAMKDRMSPPFRLNFDRIRAEIAGRNEERYSIAAEGFARFPELFADALSLAANDTNRPRALVAILRKPFVWHGGLNPANPRGLIYFMLMTCALHQLGEHEEELEEARRGRAIYPDLLSAWAYEARALVALGRLDEMERLVDEAVSLPPRWGFESCCMPRGTPGLVMLAAAEELRAHGHRDASLKIANRAADWYRGRSGDEAGRDDNRARHGEALYRAEHWPEAEAVFAALAAEKPADVNAKGWLGVIAARQGQSAEAHRISAELGALAPKYLFGIDALWRAQFAAILGDRDGAVALLRESVARGGGWSKNERESYGYGFLYPHLMDLESLRGYPPFKELVKPKG